MSAGPALVSSLATYFLFFNPCRDENKKIEIKSIFKDYTKLFARDICTCTDNLTILNEISSVKEGRIFRLLNILNIVKSSVDLETFALNISVLSSLQLKGLITRFKIIS